MAKTSMASIENMEFFEEYVNDQSRTPIGKPDWENELFVFVLPQKINPLYLNKTQRKNKSRTFSVEIQFVAKRWNDCGFEFLKWKYYDTVVKELI